MKNLFIVGLMAFSSAALASASQAASTAQPAMLVAHAGHDHGGMQHGQKAPVAHDVANAKTSKTLEVSGCWIRSLPAPAPSGGYFVVKNLGSKEVVLQGAASPDYGMVMLHQTTQKDGMSKMSATQGVSIPAGGQLEFKPGAYHAMLEDPIKAHPVGSKVSMDFLFDTGEKATAECEVKAANTKTPVSH